MKTIAVALLSMSLAACAQAPHRIQPQHVGASQYHDLDCELVAREIADRDEHVLELEERQSRARRMDITSITVGTVLIWPAYFALLATPDHSDEIARLHGETEALARVDREKCD